MDGKVTVDVCAGGRRFAVSVAQESLTSLYRAAQPASNHDAGELFKTAVASPSNNYPALHFSLTPDDKVAIVVDRWSILEAALPPILGELHQGGVQDAQTTIVGPDDPARPPEACGIKTEAHDSADLQRHGYLASTQDGRRVYLNRTVVEADQVVVVSDTHYDVETGTSGGPLVIFPGMADSKSSSDWHKLSPADLRELALEISWLLGSPFFIHTIAGSAGTIQQVIAGDAGSYEISRRALQLVWKVTVPRRPNLVLASIGGVASAHDVVSAAVRANRILEPGGTIIIVFDGEPALGDDLASLRKFDDPDDARRKLQKQPADHADALRWLKVVSSSRVMLFGGWPIETAEDLFAVGLEQPKQVQRIIDAGGDVVFLPDAHRVRAVVESMGAE